MPSLVLGQPYASGAQLVVSGNLFSGRLTPIGGIQLRWMSSGGNAYIAFSGGGPPLSGGFMTTNSGGFGLSGGCLSGMLDGFPLAPGDGFFVPMAALQIRQGPQSGSVNLWASFDPAASGVGRLNFDPF
jgi:hypothetical protein